MTPRQFSALARRNRQVEERKRYAMELMVAQCIAMVANTGFRSFEKPREPKEFMPSHWNAVPQTRRKRPAKEFTDELERVMERAVKYQEAQNCRGID